MVLGCCVGVQTGMREQTCTSSFNIPSNVYSHGAHSFVHLDWTLRFGHGDLYLSVVCAVGVYSSAHGPWLMSGKQTVE